jgi:hypothetical protein
MSRLQETVQTAQKESKPFFPQEFQIAELFLFRLSETDSALATLDRIDSALTDTTAKTRELKARVDYSRAFIYDEFKADSSHAKLFNRKSIEDYPNTDYAKRAQENLGLPVTVQTPEDLAKLQFLRAETLWTAASALPESTPDSVVLSEYQKAFALYDSVAAEFPATNTAAHALFAKAWIYDSELGDLDSAKSLYSQLASSYAKTPWGQAAKEKLMGKLTLSQAEIDRLSKRVKQIEADAAHQSKLYFGEQEKQQNLKIQVTDPKEEELLNSYESMYNFK